jgi:peptide chain release factor 2
VSDPDFWNDQVRAQRTLKERARLTAPLEGYEELTERVRETREMLEMAVDEQDESLEGELAEEVSRLEDDLDEYEMGRLLSEPQDESNAIIHVNPGAGGVDAKDWAAMLVRMYLRWCEREGCRARLVEYQEEEEGGIGSATVMVEGEHAYGLLKGESGVHRLVRISPFDSAHRRHTAFAAVFVIPEVEDDVDLDIKDEDLRVDVFRAGGHGGQHVNKTESAVRLTHLPTKIVVVCQNERSQHKNKSQAMKILRSRLAQHLEQQREEEFESTYGAQKKKIEWGSQIRSYVLAPYQLVKDVRTGEETGNVQSVLDGDIDRFIKAFLIWYGGDEGPAGE